jgi:hypothetical protein
MRVTVNPDEALVKLAKKMTGIQDKARLFEEGLRALIESRIKSGATIGSPMTSKPSQGRYPK